MASPMDGYWYSSRSQMAFLPPTPTDVSPLERSGRCCCGRCCRGLAALLDPVGCDVVVGDVVVAQQQHHSTNTAARAVCGDRFDCRFGESRCVSGAVFVALRTSHVTTSPSHVTTRPW
eukprot:GHVS01004096.1.p3 GENE.GHVS01004096.1~~GHVS01004096.1.p3  ORF type:complete len:118 (-),score=19.53 GHVS01004096.1:56-409(-)